MLILLLFVCNTFMVDVVAQLNSGEFVTKQDLAMLQTKIQSLETHVQLLEDKLKTKQDRTRLISFRAGFLHDPVPIKYNNHQVVIFNNVFLNDGNAYTSHSGMFRAPVPGLYIFTLHVLPSSTEMEFAIVTNNVHVAYMVTKASGGTESIQVLLHLQTGQEVWVLKNWGGEILRGDKLSTFSGFLLRIDDNDVLSPNGGSAIFG